MTLTLGKNTGIQKVVNKYVFLYVEVLKKQRLTPSGTQRTSCYSHVSSTKYKIHTQMMELHWLRSEFYQQKARHAWRSHSVRHGVSSYAQVSGVLFITSKK